MPTNKTDYFKLIVSAFTGFVDGSFNAQNISGCRAAVTKLTQAMINTTLALESHDNNRSLYYSTRILKWTHPSLYHCYYAGKETYLSFEGYITLDSYKDITYNVVYKTGLMFDQIRIIYDIYSGGIFYDKYVYVISRSIGRMLNIVVNPDVPRAL